MGFGIVTAHALMSLEARGKLFVSPGMQVIVFQIHFFLLSFVVLLFIAYAYASLVYNHWIN